MKTTLLSLLLGLSLTVYSQTEISEDSDKPGTTKPKIETPKTGETTPSGSQDNELPDYSAESNTQNWNRQKSDSLLRRLNIYIPAFYVGPGMDFDKIPTTFPFDQDYSYYANWNVGMGRRGWLSTASTQATYPTLGSLRTIGANLNYMITDRWIVSGGPYVSKNLIYGNPYNDMGLNGQMKFIVHDKFRINVFGQYSVYGRDNMVGNQASMFNQSSYGGTFEFKVSDSWGIEAGMKREYDPIKRKWTNTPIIGPVFYGK